MSTKSSKPKIQPKALEIAKKLIRKGGGLFEINTPCGKVNGRSMTALMDDGDGVTVRVLSHLEKTGYIQSHAEIKDYQTDSSQQSSKNTPNGMVTEIRTCEFKEDKSFEAYTLKIIIWYENKTDSFGCVSIDASSPFIHEMTASRLTLETAQSVATSKTVVYLNTDRWFEEWFERNARYTLKWVKESEKAFPYIREEYNWDTRRRELKQVTWKLRPNLKTLFVFPQLELMAKTGHCLANVALYTPEPYKDRYGIPKYGLVCHPFSCFGITGNEEKINVRDIVRIYNPGKTPKEILGLDNKEQVEFMKTVRDSSWAGRYVSMMKEGASMTDLGIMMDLNMSSSEYEDFKFVVDIKYRNKQVFSVKSLQNYLHRIDLNEAISQAEGLSLLKDYLNMCDQMGMEPRIDGDSLKREHDVCARNFKVQENELTERRVEEVGKSLEEATYQDNDFIIRPIRSVADLRDEANQQHNCVASYASRISNKTSFIFVMRNKETPDKSLITVEVSPSDYGIKQKYEAYNHRVENKKYLGFIEEWHQKKIMGVLAKNTLY